MSIKTKKRFKNLSQIVGIGLFTLLMLTNIKFALLDANEIARGDISVLGIELTLFEGTYANEAGIDCIDAPKYLCSGTIGTEWERRPEMPWD